MNVLMKYFFLGMIILSVKQTSLAATATNMLDFSNFSISLGLVLLVCLLPLLIWILRLYIKLQNLVIENDKWQKQGFAKHCNDYLKKMTPRQIQKYMTIKAKKSEQPAQSNSNNILLKSIGIGLVMLYFASESHAQATEA